MKDSNPKAIQLSEYTSTYFFIDQTNLVFDLFDDRAVVTAELAIRSNSENKKSELILNGVDLKLQSIFIDGAALAGNEYETDSETLTIKNPPDQFLLKTIVEIEPQNNTSLEGLYKSKKMYCTQCEAEGFRKITYYLDRPDVMSEFTTTVIAEKTHYPILLSNGNPVDSGVTADGRHFKKWHDPFKKPAYLFALVAGDLLPVEDTFTTQSGRTIDLKLYVEEKDLNKCDHAMLALKNSMKWDEDVYGREYDLDLFMIVAVDDFNMGAMENKGLNIFNTSCVLAQPEITTDAAFQRVEGVVAHEYFHNWSGNRVTCRDWFQLSLKEGFTVFRDSQFSADMGSPTVKRVEDVSFLRTLQFAEDAGPMSHPVQPSSYIEISNFYTLTIYEKGSEIVRMIYNLLGPEKFREGSDLYFERHDGQAVTINEFVQAMVDVSGKDLTQFKLWYTQAGTPRLKFTDNYNSESGSYSLDVEQSCPITPESNKKLPFHIPISVALVGADGELECSMEGSNVSQKQHVLELTQQKQSFQFKNLPEKPVPSLLRGFSAPVKYHYEYSRDGLLSLIKNDRDGFCRWDAVQQLAIQIIHEQMQAYCQGTTVVVDQRLPVALKSLLEESEKPSTDKAMIALMLQLPTEAYLSEIAETIEVDAIHKSREKVIGSVAETLELKFLDVYNGLNINQEYQPAAEQIGQRSLKNISLSYLVKLNKKEYIVLAFNQFQSSNNMTDRLAAIRALVNSSNTDAQEFSKKILSEFYNSLRDEPLALDIWLQVQASADHEHVLEQVVSLMEHECFDITNPNKVRSLVGGFCGQNLHHFHNISGAGYQFLGDRIIQLNSLNPQIAARLITPLTRWRKYDSKRQSLMQAQLQRILDEPKLSKDVYEVVSKSLAV